MASRGSHIRGTDGTDFRHRQQVVSTHTQSAKLKSYLKTTLYLQSILNLIILLKLSEDLLDRADIFILELQELRIPKPDLWEWLYGGSLITLLVAGRSFKTNSTFMIKVFLASVTCLSFVPLLIGECKYLPDFIQFVQVKNVEEIKYVWRNWPVSVFFQIFAVAGLQIHGAQIWYGLKLLKLWTQYQVKRD